MVYDESGAPIRRVDGSTDSGFQRVAWDLRYPAARVPNMERGKATRTFPTLRIRGRWCWLGTYSVQAFEKIGGVESEVAGRQTFKVATEQLSSMNAPDRTAQEEFQRKVGRLYRAVYGAQQTAENVESRLKSIRQALAETPAAEKQLGAWLIRSNSATGRSCERCGAMLKSPGEMSRCLRRLAIA